MAQPTLPVSWLNASRSRQPGAQRGTARGSASPSRVRGTLLTVYRGPDAHLSAPSKTAAAPSQARFDAEDGSTLWLTVPAASASNTEVIWNEYAQRLSVAVWPRSLDRQGGTGDSDHQRPRRMLSHASFWLPEHDGASATASLARGVVTLRVPTKVSRAAA